MNGYKEHNGFQVCDLQVATARRGRSHRFLGHCKYHLVPQGPSVVGQPKNSYSLMKSSNSINANVIHEAKIFISKSWQRYSC